nr:hypothetical protein BaRGS_021089 [Batillaria attramentaria]
MPKAPDPTVPVKGENAESSENLSSTVENILKSIGFNFDLSRRMQELARQKKEQEQQGLTINQSASFLGSGGLPHDITASVFQKDTKPDLQGDAKKEEPKVQYEYFDPGSHWCQPCNVMCGHMFDFFKHIESKRHQQKLDPFDKPWLMEALQKSEGKIKEGPVQAHPIKGLEFMMATRAFYCCLCKEFCGDLSVAESHMKSDEHTQKYREYIREHPYYEKRYMLERSASLSMQRPYSPEPEEESSDDDANVLPSKKKAGRGSSVDRKSQKDEKKPKSDKDDKKKDKDRRKSDKDEKKTDRDRKDDERDYDRDYDRDRDEKKYDRDGKKYDRDDKKKRDKKDFRGIPDEDCMYADREERRRDSDRKKDYKTSERSGDRRQSPKAAKDLPAPKDPKTGKVETEHTAQAEEMKQMGIDPQSLLPSVTPVVPPPPSQNLSLPPELQPNPQAALSNLGEEPSLLVEEEPGQMSGSPDLGVDPEGDPVDFSLEPVDFEELVGMEENSNAAPPAEAPANEDPADSTDDGI